MRKSGQICFLVYLLMVMLLIAGCVQQPIEGGLTSQQLANRTKESAKIHTELAAEYLYRGQYRVAIEEVDAALSAVSRYAPAFNVQGLINMALNENQQAMTSFQQAIKYAPKDAEINNNFGWFLCERYPNQIDQAMTHFNVALEDPLYATPEKSYANAGLCELKRNNHAAALDYFQQALLINSAFSPALIGLIEVDVARGDFTRAKTKLAHFTQNNQQTAKSLWLAIQIERAEQDRLAEDSYIFQLLKHFPDSDEAIALRKDRMK